MRSVREFDKDLCVIIRTGDASPDLADGAIEVRAFRRAIKGRTSITELRELTMAAVQETRDRRQLSADAANTTAVKTQWAQALGSVEEAISVTDSYKGIVHGIRNQLTAIAGVAEVLTEAAKRGQAHLLNDYVAKNKLLVERLLADVNTFLDGPFSETLRSTPNEGRTTANGVIESLQKHFLKSSGKDADPLPLSIVGLSQNMFISAPPIRLLIAMRHLVEFCLQRRAPKSTIRLTAHCVDHAVSAIDSLSSPKLVFTEHLMSRDGIYLAFRISGHLPATPLEEIRRSFHDFPDDPHSGNLQMISLALRGELAGVTVHLDRDETTVFNLYVPISR